MTQKRLFFRPEQVDEQVDQLSLNLPGQRVQRAASQKQKPEPGQKDGKRVHLGEQTEPQPEVPTRLVQDLQAYYQIEFQHNREALAHAWWQIAAHQPANHASTHAEDAISSSPRLPFLPERIHVMPNPKTSAQSSGSKVGRRISLLAATLVAVVLVGTLGVALVLSRSSHQTQVATGNTPIATSVPHATPTPLPVGTVVHTQVSPTGMHAYILAWSPDGTRVASIVGNPSGAKSQLLIWDASTGGHLQTIPFATSFGEIHWSPTGKYLALSNLKYIMIVDSQTGSVVKTFDSGIDVAPPPTTSVGSPATGPQPLSSLFPLGGGYGFFSIAWAPDGSTLAVVDSLFTSSKVELLDPLTGAVKATLLSSYGQIGELGFSSDGQYLAASNDEQVVVWRVASRSIVFQKNPGQSTSIAWQPGTHNLSVLLLYPDNLQLWDIDAQKVTKTYPGVGVFAWSLDGKEIAVRASSLMGALTHTATSSPTSGKVVILDAASGASVATYTSQEPSIIALAWSPDGRYIASIEGHAVSTSTGGSISTLIRVWVA